MGQEPSSHLLCFQEEHFQNWEGTDHSDGRCRLFKTNWRRVAPSTGDMKGNCQRLFAYLSNCWGHMFGQILTNMCEEGYLVVWECTLEEFEYSQNGNMFQKTKHQGRAMYGNATFQMFLGIREVGWLFWPFRCCFSLKNINKQENQKKSSLLVCTWESRNDRLKNVNGSSWFGPSFDIAWYIWFKVSA